MDYQENFERKKTRKEVLDPAEDFVGTLDGGSQFGRNMMTKDLKKHSA